MERHREARRASIVGSNGFNRRRHRTNSIRDSPDEDGGLELQDSVRLRDRMKKDRERDKDRERERERERERVREREKYSRNKRRRGDRLTSNREDIGGDETSEEDSLNDDEDDEDDENTTTGGGVVRLLPPAVGSISNHHHDHNSNHHHSHTSSFSQQHNSNSTSNTVSTNHHLQHRKSFLPNPSSAKISRAPPVWKSGDEMISVPVPRKARSASTKRSHDWMPISSNNSGGGVPGVEQNLAQPSSSPARQGVAPTATPTPPPPPMSPASPNVSIRKKLKPSANNSGQKLKLPKVATKPSSNSSNPEELEIEIAEVLFGLMTQSQAPSSKKEDSRNLSPVPNFSSANNLISGSNSGPLSAVAPKRKRPREIPENTSYGSRSSGIQAKPDVNQEPKNEKISGSVAENGYENSVHPQPPEPIPPVSAKIDSEAKPTSEELKESRETIAKEACSPKEKESPTAKIEASQKGDPPVAVTSSSAAETTKSNSTASEMENGKEEKFEIDLMAPPLVRPSPEREEKTDSRDSPVAKKAVVPISDAAVMKVEVDENGNSERDDSLVEEKKVKAAGEDVESKKVVENKERNVDLHVDLRKCERDGGDGVNTAGNGNKSQSLTQKQQQQQPLPEKSGNSTSSFPLPMSVASWPGGLPQMGYMASLQGVVSMEDGAVVAPGHIPPLFTQPRPKRCATHCHIARNIHYLQQFMKMNPLWPPPAASASLFGSKPCNLNVISAPDIHGNVAVRGANTAQDKGPNVANIPNHVTKEKGSQPVSAPDSGQRKQQILIQQALPPVAPSNLLGPAFIFPLNHQQQSAAPRPSGVKSSAAAGVSSNASGSAVTSSSSAAAVSFNYPNMAYNETQYLAIVQNNGYSFPIPAAAVGAPPNYRGNPAQAMPLFNGPFYSSQMIHPSQLQHAQPPSIQSQLLQAHQNASASSDSSASQKQLQSQQQRIQSGGVSSGSGTASLQNLSSKKTQTPLQLQQSHNQYVHQSRPRHHEGEAGREDSPSTTDSRGSRASMNIYGHNFSMPIHPPNFGLMPHPAALASAGAATATATATSASISHGDMKGHQTQQQGLKAGPDALPAHSFAMTFGTMNGAAAGPGIDIASMAQNHAAIFQNSSEVRQNIQMMATAAAAQAAQKNYRVSDDGKSGGVDSAAAEDELKSLNGKGLGGGGQSIAFTRSDVADGPVSSVIESSSRSLNSAAPGAARGSRSTTTNASAGAMNVQNAHNIQAQLQQQHMLQLKQHQQQQQQMHHQQQQQMQQIAANAVSRSKVGSLNSNGSMYPEHLNSSSKFPNGLSGFPQNLVHNSSSSSPSQSPQWKASGRTSIPQTSSTTTTLKNLPQQQQHSRTQISFGGNQKPSVASQGPNNNQTTSPQMMVCSPTISSISKGASGSPRTSSTSTNNKTSQASSLSAQPIKNSPSVTNNKSLSILGNPHVAAAGSIENSQLQQMPKAMQQQLFFSNPYAQSQPPHLSGKNSATSGASGYYMARRQTDQHQQSPSAPVTSGAGLSLCPPVTLGGANTNDPATAIAAATANVKGGGLLSQSIIHASQFGAQTVLPASFSYAHPVPAAVPVKPAEQKQPAGNDNLHQWQPEKK